jgi:hypothetical protein
MEVPPVQQLRQAQPLPSVAGRTSPASAISVSSSAVMASRSGRCDARIKRALPSYSTILAW